MTTASNFFQLFNLPVVHGIDLVQLEAEYQRLSLETHPDFFSTAPTEEQQEALRQSAEVNEGYRILRSEPARAAYLLALLAQATELDTTALPAGFLEEMFFLQEELDDLESNNDQKRMAELKSQITERLALVGSSRAALFQDALVNKTQAGLQAIQSNLNCEKYLQRLMARL